MNAETLSLFLVGLLVLLGGAEVLVRGATRLSLALGISPLVVGLTVVAYGTGSPELAVSVEASLSDRAGLALGNVVGSNIVNVLLVLGAAALIAPLHVAVQLVRLDVPLLIAVSFLVLLLAADGRLGRLDGAILFAGGVAYTVFVIRQNRDESAETTARYAREFATVAAPGRGAIGDLALVAAGVGAVVLGAHLMVRAAVALAVTFGFSELVIGLTIVAVGTSLPEVATSVVASFRGARDIAVGNAVGSNLFNILFVLGLAALLAPGGVTVAPAALHFDMPVMIAAAVACLPIFFTGHVIARWEGALFVGYYVAYSLYLILDAVGHDTLPVFSTIMVTFVMPLTVLTLMVVTARTIRQRRRPPPPEDHHGEGGPGKDRAS